MKWRDKRTDVVEDAATAILDALKHTVAEHHRTVAEVRRALEQGGPQRD